MEKPDRDIPAPEESKGLLAKLRKWIKSRFGRSHDPLSNVKTYPPVREEIPELMPKAQKPTPVAHETKKPETPKVVKQKIIPPPIQKGPEQKTITKDEPTKGKPAFKIKPKKIGVPDLNRLSHEEFARRLTGEVHLEDEEIQKIANPSLKDLAAKNEPAKDIRPTLKGYPTEIRKEEDQLDLHGKTAAEAKREINSFILWASRKSRKLIRIITGKGIHSPLEKGPVLKNVALDEVIRLKKEGKVFKYEWENKGALLVYLT
jgi:DNA-nicking Smr family endonuclease